MYDSIFHLGRLVNGKVISTGVEMVCTTHTYRGLVDFYDTEENAHPILQREIQ